MCKGDADKRKKEEEGTTIYVYFILHNNQHAVHTP